MTKLSNRVRLAVRQRADFACEYCGVREKDSGGELTIDHFHPRSRGGTDHIDNLVYCCSRCNLYKQDFWNQNAQIWNPRNKPFTTHFFEDMSGELFGLDEIGSRTIAQLRLNRRALIAHRRQRRDEIQHDWEVERYKEIVQLHTQTIQRLYDLVIGQQELLDEQNELLSILLKR